MDSAKLSDAEKLCFTSLIEVSDRIHKRSLTSADVTRAVLDRIAALNPKLHAYLRVFEDSAMKSAAAADNEIGAGKWRGPLHGVPVAVKDLCQTKGEITTCASKLLRDWRPDSNAAVVDSFERAGAVLLGKLNLTEFAVAWYHPEMPVPLNPWDAALWPGAS
ncbi:MAG TPA: amidase, partial [Candidatus Binataceae bacterium]|nr:amidase [Candidatus Binataceae bacterium]